MPALHVPGEELDGVAHYRPLHGERAQPGAIMVDRSGRRFVDEAQNYGDVGRAMRRRPTASARRAGWSSTPPTAAATRSGPLEPGDARPALAGPRADDLDALARCIGVDAPAPSATR